MQRYWWALGFGVVMIVVGIVLFVTYQGVDTPVIGLRQVGLVVAVLGAVELITTVVAMRRSRS